VNLISTFLWSIVFILLWMVIIMYYGKSIVGYIIQKKIYKLSHMMHKNLKRDFEHVSITYDMIMEHNISFDNIEFDKENKIIKYKNGKEEFHLFGFAILDKTNDQLLLFKNRREFKKYSDFYIKQLLVHVLENRKGA